MFFNQKDKRREDLYHNVLLSTADFFYKKYYKRKCHRKVIDSKEFLRRLHAYINPMACNKH